MSLAYDFDDMGAEQGDEAIARALRAVAADNDNAAISAKAFSFRDPATIPPRRFLYGRELRRGQLSAVVAPGAAGKTTFKVGRALAMVTGRPLLGTPVWNGPHRTWLWNLEDEVEEIERTIHAFMKLWDLSPSDLGGRLFVDGVDSPGTTKLKIAVEKPGGGYMLQPDVSDSLIAEIRAQKIDYLDIDPFVSSHSIDENSNGAIDAVAKEWVRIAQLGQCAVSLAHHVRKPNGTEASAYDARGAIAMINAARSVLVFQTMTKEVAIEFGIPLCDRKSYFSVIDDKNNKQPPAARANWFKFESVDLGNADAHGPADNIGAINPWEAPDAFAGMTARKLRHIQEQIEKHPERARFTPASTGWVGKLVADVTGHDLLDPHGKAVVQKMIATWVGEGALLVVSRRCPTSKRDVPYVEVRQWAIVE